MIDTTIPYYVSANEEERELYRKWLVSHLKMGEICLTFKKKDGTIRQMKATLHENSIPKVESVTDSTRKRSPDVVSVWDLEKSAWRSVRYDSIQQIKFDLGE